MASLAVMTDVDVAIIAVYGLSCYFSAVVEMVADLATVSAVNPI